jgi:hypothetical protein
MPWAGLLCRRIGRYRDAYADRSVPYFLVPLGLTIDLMPEGLKATPAPKLADKGLEGFHQTGPRRT